MSSRQLSLAVPPTAGSNRQPPANPTATANNATRAACACIVRHWQAGPCSVGLGRAAVAEADLGQEGGRPGGQQQRRRWRGKRGWGVWAVPLVSGATPAALTVWSRAQIDIISPTHGGGERRRRAGFGLKGPTANVAMRRGPRSAYAGENQVSLSQGTSSGEKPSKNTQEAAEPPLLRLR